MKRLNSRKGFTLIELLVVIGILAVLAAIAIPSVAGLIDRANVSADKTNANEMTNAVERFTSEYELYCQDIASGAIKDADNNGTPDDMDAAQGRVFNVTGAVSRSDITALESTGLGAKQINRDTKYPENVATVKAVVENYTKTSSSTFEPKQSDMHFWYSPDCGVIVFAEPDADIVEDLNSQILSGKDAKGNELSTSTEWINLTDSSANNDDGVTNQFRVTVRCWSDEEMDYVGSEATLTWEEFCTAENAQKYNYPVHNVNTSQLDFMDCYSLVSIEIPDSVTVVGNHTFNGCIGLRSVVLPESVNCIKAYAFQSCIGLKTISIPKSVTSIEKNAFDDCETLETINYGGSMSDWNNINLEANWNSICPEIRVVCSDGTLTIAEHPEYTEYFG